MTTEALQYLPANGWIDDPATRAVVSALEAKGGANVARFVGGCVRDTLLGRAGPGLDIDIATTLTPPRVVEALQSAGLKAVPTGIAHGTVTAVSRGRPFEVTTLRRDVETDGRRAVVAFTMDWAEDAARRDFRLNALYAEPNGRLHDPTGCGVADALAGRIVFVGEPEQRIREDYLRILRFFRFCAWYGRGKPDAAGLAACGALASGIAVLSGERIAKELLKLLAPPDSVPSVKRMQAIGVLAQVLDFADVARLERVVGIERTLDRPADPALRLAALNAGEPLALARRLHLPNALRDRLVVAAGEPEAVDQDARAARRRLYALGAQSFTDRLMLGADVAHAESVAVLLELAEAWRAPPFPVDGAQIKAAGVAQGPAVGEVRRAVERWWVEHDFPDDPAAVHAALAAAAASRQA